MPLLDQLLGGSLLSGVMDIIKMFVKSPEDQLKAQQMLLDFQTKAQENEAKVIESINATMREEAKSEHWMQWAWRPVFGFSGSAILINNYILLPYFTKVGIVPIVIPTEVWVMLMAVLGVAAWTRGQEKIEKIKNA